MNMATLMTTILLMITTALSFFTTTSSSSSATEIKRCKGCPSPFTRSGFGKDFVFGAASAAYQYEGAYNINGKGQSIWDEYTHKYPERIDDNSTGDVAIDSYHRYKDDVRIAKEMGLDAYRFSVSWSRILPNGTISGGVNQDGIDYYNNLINECIANGLKPFVTIFHFNLPLALENKYGGFLGRQIIDDLREFADLLFCQFGDRVKHWITLNEPWSFSNCGYCLGTLAPGRCSKWQGSCIGHGDSGTEPYTVTHNQLLAHAAIVDLYKTKYQKWQKGQIGVTLISAWFEAPTNSKEDKAAQQRALDFMLGWFIHPITYGKYPDSMVELVKDRLPKFNTSESKMLTGSMDFLGLNYYTTYYATNLPNETSRCYTTDSRVDQSGIYNGTAIGPQGRKDSWLFIYPVGLRKLLIHIKRNYKNPAIYITENGLDEAKDDTLSLFASLNDTMRRDYLEDHLCCIYTARAFPKVNVKGYFAWSLMDNYEWNCGYSVRFGVNYVDYKNDLTRYPKLSALWYKSFLVKKAKANVQDHLMMISDE